MFSYRKIVLAYDGALASQQSLLASKELSQWPNAEVHLLALVGYESVSLGPEVGFYNEDQNNVEYERLNAVLAEGVIQLKQRKENVIGQLRIGDPVDQIVKYSKEIDADLIVLGHKHQNNWLERWWRGSIPKALIEHSHCSVLVVIHE